MSVSLPVQGWGPHPEITRAALQTLPGDDPLLRHLGNIAEKLTNHCWMGDYASFVYTDGEQQFYADDYLFFPGISRHFSHVCPEVIQTYDPYFRRAVQALRTESAENAARWIGSILHFVEDTGAPPHAMGLNGPLHSKMENWVDPSAISIAGYHPRILGKTLEEAVTGLQERMQGLIAFSKKVGERAKPLVEANERAKVEPIVLESALETSRVTADLLRTLGQVALQTPVEGCALHGEIESHSPRALEKMPAKIILAGTRFSTLPDARGHFEFRGLPPGEQTIWVMRAGNEIASRTVVLSSSEQTLKLALRPGLSRSNLLRNPEFQLSWVATNMPDAWTAPSAGGGRSGWASELIPVSAGETYLLAVNWKKSAAAGEVLLRWRTEQNHPISEEEAVTKSEREVTRRAPAEAKFAQVWIVSPHPGSAIQWVGFSRKE